MSQDLFIVGWQPISTKRFGSSQDVLLNTPEEYYRYIGLLPDETRQRPPLPGIQIDREAGATFSFYVTDGRLASAFEYRSQATGEEMSSWIICTSFSLTFPNKEYLAGKIEVRAKAADNLAASTSIYNTDTFHSYTYPLEIVAINGHQIVDTNTVYYAGTRQLEFTVKSTGDYTRLMSSYISVTGYYPLQGVPAGLSVFRQDVSGSSGNPALPGPQRRLWLETLSGFSTPKYVVNLGS